MMLEGAWYPVHTLLIWIVKIQKARDIGRNSEFKKLSLGSSRTIVDVVAEEFGLVLEEIRLSTSNAFPVPRNEDKCRWWQWIIELDKRIANHIRYKHYMRTIFGGT